jgi:hypothetical protein
LRRSGGRIDEEVFKAKLYAAVPHGKSPLSGAFLAKGELSTRQAAASAHENDGFAVAADGADHSTNYKPRHGKSIASKL